ncbi:MAG: ubiquitin-like domain-containing protein [Chloroflexota bacterium]
MEADSSQQQPHSTPQPGNSTQPAWLIPLLIGIGVILALVVISIVLVIIPLTHTFPVTVVADGQARQLETHSDTVAGLLKLANVALNDGDRVLPPPDSTLEAEMMVRVERARSVFVTVDGQTTPLWTPLTNPAEILASEGVNLISSDRILIDGTASSVEQLALWPVPVSSIEVRHAVTLRIHDQGSTRTITTTSNTVGEALFEAGITLYLTDSTTPDTNAPLTNGLDVSITRARPVEILADGSTLQTRSRGSTVADALADAGVALVGMDYAIPAESSALQPGMSIRVIRVHEEIEATQQPLPFETVYQADATVELDQQKVAQQGQPGVQETRTRVRYENGIAVEREQAETVVTQAPVNKIISYGTNVVVHTLDTPDGTISYWRVVRMYVTSYHPVDDDNTTATGHILQKGIVGADVRLLPYGSMVYVAGYGVGEVQDTGPSRANSLWLDLGYTNEDYRGWYGYHDVYLLTPVPAAIDYTLPGS